MLSVAMKRGRVLSEWLRVGVTVVVNVLDDGQTDMVAFFGRGVTPGKDIFNDLEIERTSDNTAILAESLAYLECRVESSTPAGDHEILLLRIQEGRVLGEGKPMIHVRKNGLHY